MKKIIKQKVSLIIPALLLALSLTACNSASEDSKGNAAGNSSAGSLSGKITISGSTAVQPLIQELADAFTAEEPGIAVEIQGSSSTQGIADVTSGTTDIGISSRELRDSEKSPDLKEYILAYDGIAVVANPGNTAANLTKEQLAGIFKGEIKNWNKVGGPDKEILVMVREENSGIRDAFEELLNLKGQIGADVLQADGAGAVKANIAAKDNAIGYISLGDIDDSMRKLTLDGTECTSSNIKDKSYPFTLPMIMIAKGELKPEAKAFFDFIESENGRKIIGKKYIPAKN